MIKGLAITPPVIGRIGIGSVVERNGKRLPEKDDFFTITTLVQNKAGWVNHPLHDTLVAGAANGKLRSIPVKVLFNNPDLNLRAQYSLFDRTNGRPVCAGNGETAKRVTETGIESIPCPSPDGCKHGQQHGCKAFGRLNVQIEGQEDPMGTFIFRTTGFNSIRTLAARLSYFNAISGGNLSSMPLQLKLRAKSTTQSHRTAIYFVDLAIRDGLSIEEAVTKAKAETEARLLAGVDLVALEQVALKGFSNGAFEEGEDEVPAIVEEFFTEVQPGDRAGTDSKGAGTSLADKLATKAQAGVEAT